MQNTKYTLQNCKIQKCNDPISVIGIGAHVGTAENVESLTTKNAGVLILSIAEYQYKDSLVVDKEINFAALLVSLKELK